MTRDCFDLNGGLIWNTSRSPALQGAQTSLLCHRGCAPHLKGGAGGAEDSHNRLLGGSSSVVLLAAALARHNDHAPWQRVRALLRHLLPAPCATAIGLKNPPEGAQGSKALSALSECLYSAQQPSRQAAVGPMRVLNTVQTCAV